MNSKLEGPHLGWADFRGLTCLFDHGPSHHRLIESVGARRLCCQLDDPDLALYARLDELLGELAKSGLNREHGFAPLDSETFHITACDLVHDANLAKLDPNIGDVVSEHFSRLPQSASERFGADELFRQCELDAERIHFEFERLAIFGPALVALVKPASETCQERLERVIEWRNHVDDAWKAHCEKPRNPSYKPHVSLGYFAKSAEVAQYTQAVERWNGEFAENLFDFRVTVDNIRPYFFTDMVSFWACG